MRLPIPYLCTFEKMMKKSIVFVLMFGLALGLKAQDKLVIRQVEKLPEGVEKLLLPDDDLRGKVVETEMALDLVDAWMADSVLEERRQRLAGFGGWMAQRFASRYWQYFNPTKQKYVGSMSRPFKLYDGMGDEYDINIFLMPHLSPYVEMARAGFDEARSRPRAEGPFRFDEPEGFPCPEELKYEGKGYITIECEGTPNRQFHEQMTAGFLPMGKGEHDLGKWPQVGTEYASFGMYGAWCMDCNHNCRPEIHPFEWLWWLDLSEDRPGGPNAKSWMIGVFADDSRRFKDWSHRPKTGIMSVPVALPSDAKVCTVNLEHLFFDEFEMEGLAALNLPPNTLAASPGTKKYLSGSSESKSNLEIELTIEGEETGEGMQLWWSEFTEDAKTGQRLGYLNIALSVESIYGGRLTVDYR
jgi:hypothetical protein